MKQNWQIKKLGEVCEINIGRTPERGNRAFWDTEKTTNNIWLSIADLNKTEKGYISDSSEYVSDLAVPKMKLIKANTLLMSFKLTIGRCAITKCNLYTNEAIAALPIKTNDLDIFYLKYYLCGFDWNKMTEGDTKVKGKTLNKEKLKEVPIVVPPLADQRRIVVILDSKFAKIDALKAAAQKNLDNAEQLWKAQLEKEFGNKEWKMMKLGEVAKVSSSKRIYADELSQSGVPFLRVSDVVSRINGTETCDLYIPEEKYQSFVDKGLVPKENDVLVTSRGTLGLCYIIKATDKFYFQDGMITWLALKENINPKLIYYLFDSQIVREQINNKAAGAAVSYISIADIKNFTIPIPSLAEQTAIVSRLDALSAQISDLKAKYRRQIECCDELRQSLLREAFEGEM